MDERKLIAGMLLASVYPKLCDYCKELDGDTTQGMIDTAIESALNVADLLLAKFPDSEPIANLDVKPNNLNP